jgi:hypothetical protein
MNLSQHEVMPLFKRSNEIIRALERREWFPCDDVVRKEDVCREFSEVRVGEDQFRPDEVLSNERGHGKFLNWCENPERFAAVSSSWTSFGVASNRLLPSAQCSLRDPNEGLNVRNKFAGLAHVSLECQNCDFSGSSPSSVVIVPIGGRREGGRGSPRRLVGWPFLTPYFTGIESTAGRMRYMMARDWCGLGSFKK